MHYASRSVSSIDSIRTILFLAIVAVIAVVPVFFVTSAAKKGGGFTNQTASHDKGLPNYDIRLDKTAYEQLAGMRERQGRNAAMAADLREDFAAGEQELAARVPSLKVMYDPATRTPELIGPDVLQGKNFLTRGGGDRDGTLRAFVSENEKLFGMRRELVGKLKVVADYKNPEGGLSFVRLTQEINGVQVFAGEIRAGFVKNGELVRVVNNLAAGIGAENVSADFGNAVNAIRSAAGNIGYAFAETELAKLSIEEGSDKVILGKGDWAPSAEKIYFPIEPGVAVPAWRVLLWQSVNAFYVIVDADSGDVLWRKNITEDQTQPATYNVWTNPSAMMNVADNPFPMTPGPASQNGTQGSALARNLVSIVGNEVPYQFNNNGWISDGVDTTDGNAVEAGLDRDGLGTQPSNGVDANGKPNGSTFRVFDFPINPGIPTNPALNQGDSPLPASVTTPGACVAAGTSPAMIDFQRASVTQLFYISNRYHDEMYRLGFTEQAGNFQQDNFSRGGLGGDRVSAEGQDCSGTNNANFGTPADGGRGRMQMYIWTAPTPDFDGNLDADVVIHELTHGLSNRLHGNAAGLSGNMARGMGEGWSDFYGHAMLSQESDAIDGIYTTGAYDTYRLRVPVNEFNNYYYGIRRFPKAILSSVGGPNNRPHNPLTFADIDATQISVSNGAFSPAFNASADQVHATGEVWSSMLWEVRAKYIQRLGWEIGNRRILQHVTDGMKLAPLNPTLVDSRDAIVAAALAGGTDADVRDIWSGFAVRGLGSSAVVLNPGSGGGTARVTEAFDLPNLFQLPTLVVSDAVGDNDGFFEPGEPISISFSLTNKTGSTATGVTATVVGGVSADYGTITHNATAVRDLSFTIPAGTNCGAVLNLVFNVNSSLGPVVFTRVLRIGQPITAMAENFDGVTAPAIPAGWTAEAELSGINFVTSTGTPNTAPNAAFALDPATVGGGTTLTSPSVAIGSPAAAVTFRNRWSTEAGWDGGVLEISIAEGAFQDIIAAGGIWESNGYTGVLGPNGVNNPIAGRNAWTGDSGGYVTTTAIVPPSAVGQNARFRWRFGADDNTAVIGWSVDNISVVGNYSCSYLPVRENVRADFDGDGRSDLSVFRQSDGIWYVLGSTQGFFSYRWGTNGDVPIPADYDRDGKTDPAVYRRNPGANSEFYVLKSDGFLFSGAVWGLTEDIPFVRDYDGDELPDFSIYRPSEGNWYVFRTSGGHEVFNFGQPGDVPLTGDFDGDGIGDAAVFRNGSWIVRQSSGGVSVTQWGLATDKLVPADYDGDSKDDLAIFRPNDGTWWVLRSSDGGIEVVQWGLSGDLPVPGDYDGDGRADKSVYRGAGEWYVYRSSGGFEFGHFGLPTDLPAAAAYIP